MDTPSDGATRLNKFLAFHLGVSRREADSLISRGSIAINGKPVQLGGRVINSDTVSLNGKPIMRKNSFTYVILHKPRGYVCSRKQQGDAPTIYSLLPAKYHDLKPVGRLDADSSGLILLTDDGDFAFHMTHPKFTKTKIYSVTLSKPLQPLHRQMISDFGVMLEDGKSQFLISRPDEKRPEDDLHWQITMSEGRNRQIRRTFSALGYTVTGLHRTVFGAYTLGELPPSKFEVIHVSSSK
jgi:pseudouridine synthase